MNDARRSGFKWVGAGALLAAIWIAAVLLMDSRGWSMYGPALGLPIIPFLIGLTQLTTGRLFAELAHAWDSLAGWQRGVLGFAIVGIASAIIAGGNRRGALDLRERIRPKGQTNRDGLVSRSPVAVLGE